MTSRIITNCFKSENITFKYDVNIDKEGIFTTTIPEEISLQMIKVGIKLNKNRQNNYGFFSAQSLKELKEKVEETAKKYSEKELISEKIVMQYNISTICHYCKGKDGTIYPNGNWQMKKEKEYNWVCGTNKRSENSSEPFGFNVFFELKKVKTWKFPDGEIKKEYFNIKEEELCDETARWLNSIVRMKRVNCDNIQEIDYSVETGVFFKNMILYICNMNEKLLKIFGGEVDLNKIDFKKTPQLTFLGNNNGDI